MYDPVMIQPMRDELTTIGVEELRTAQDVDRFFSNREGSALLVVNSVCGCAAGGARPAVRLALQNEKRPHRLATVFAGADVEATQRAREHLPEYPPSSPSLVLLKDGKVVHFVHRHQIEMADASAVAENLIGAFNTHCTQDAS